VPYCPRRILAEQDPFTSHVLGIYRDYKYGNVEGWPKAHSAAVVDAVRYLDGELDAAQVESVNG